MVNLKNLYIFTKYFNSGESVDSSESVDLGESGDSDESVG